MKVILTGKHTFPDSESWTEEYERPDGSDGEAWARELVQNFNATLGRYERMREVVSVECIDAVPEEPGQAFGNE